MAGEGDDSIFGRVRMGYLVIGSRKLGEWKRFCVDAIGLHLAFESADELAFRMDEHARRVIVQNDASEDVLSVGWHLDDEAALAVVLERLARRGAHVECMSGEQAQRRGVDTFHRVVGPKRLALEFFTRPRVDDSPLRMLCSGFNTGAAGMGHMSLMSREPERSQAFWQELLDARVSDRIELEVGGKPVLDVTFLRVNERHHSIAIAATRRLPIDMFRTRIQHFNIEAATLDDLSGAFERCRDLGFRLARNVGQHPNDKELSFYVVTPSGFDFEVGWDALAVDEAVWPEGVTYPNMSTWGHDIPGVFSSELGLSHLVHGARSLMKAEYLPW